MITEPKIDHAGFATLLGIDSSLHPTLIPENKAQFAVNLQFRRGFPKTRPPFNKRALVFPDTETEAWFNNNALQGAIVYQPRDRSGVIVASSGGRIFEIQPDTWRVKEITPRGQTTASAFTAPAVGASVAVTVADATGILVGYPLMIDGYNYMVTGISGTIITVTNLNAPPGAVAAGVVVCFLDPNRPSLPRAWMVQAELFLIIQDGERRPIIYDGASVFRSDIGKQQVPVGTVMAYGIGRLWVAINKKQFVAGDIVGGPLPNGGASLYSNLDNILYFTENTFLAGGGAFSVPLQAGEITAMQFMPVLDTSTGNGPLLIFTRSTAFSVNAPTIRALWAVVQSPIQTVVLTGGGSLSQYATVATTNSDVFFRSADGVRSFILAVRQFNNSWGNTPISAEMDRILENEDELLLTYSSAIQFDNRLLFTVTPQPTRWNAYFLGIGVLDFDPISSMANKAPPDYDGIWTGIRPILLLKGDMAGIERAFAFALSADGDVELWEIQKKGIFDNGNGRIDSVIETKALTGKSPHELKRLFGGELYVSDVVGQVDFTLFYKPDDYDCWFPWTVQRTVCAEWESCPDPDDQCHAPVVKRPGYKTRLNFGQPPELSEQVDNKPARVGYDFQFRIEWTGHCRIRKFVARFSGIDEEPNKPVDETVECSITDCCPKDDFAFVSNDATEPIPD